MFHVKHLAEYLRSSPAAARSLGMRKLGAFGAKLAARQTFSRQSYWGLSNAIAGKRLSAGSNRVFTPRSDRIDARAKSQCRFDFVLECRFGALNGDNPSRATLFQQVRVGLDSRALPKSTRDLSTRAHERALSR